MDQMSMVPPMTPPAKKTVIRSGVVLVIALIVAAGLLVYFSEPVQEALSAWTLPKELRTAQFISYAEDGGVYGVSSMGYQKQELARQPEAAAVLSNEQNAVTRKGQWTVSPNKTQVAFTELTVPHQPHRTQSWQVSVADARTGSQKAIGGGFGVVFINERTVARLTETGIVVTDLDAGTEKNILPLTFEKVPSTVSVSPNGALIAWVEADEHTIVVYSIGDGAATRVTQYVGEFTTFTLANDAIYLVRPVDRGTAVIRYPIAEGAVETHLHTLPASLEISRVSFP